MYVTQKNDVRDEVKREVKPELGVIDDIFVKLQFGCHPVAVVQYTFTRKQYTERHKTNNT